MAKGREDETKDRVPGWIRGLSIALVSNVRKQSDVTGTLNCERQLTLMLGAGTGRAAGQNLAALGHVAAELSSIFVVDKSASIGTELANLSALVVLCVVLIKSQGCILL